MESSMPLSQVGITPKQVLWFNHTPESVHFGVFSEEIAKETNAAKLKKKSGSEWGERIKLGVGGKWIDFKTLKIDLSPARDSKASWVY